MEERKALIMYYLGNYRKSYHNDGLFNYYQIFDLDRNMGIEQIVKYVKEKQLKKLLHPDWISYLDQEDQEDFKKLSSIVDSMLNDFRDENSRKRYDDRLNIMLQEKNNHLFKEGSDKTFHNDNVSLSEMEDFNLAVKKNILKYGFQWTENALKKVYHDDMNGFTREDGIRNFIRDLGKDKIDHILGQYCLGGSGVEIDYSNKIFNYLVNLLTNDVELRKKLDSYIAACCATIFKYQGSNHPVLAIKEFIFDGDYNGFTRDFDARSNLKGCVLKWDGRFLTLAYLSNFKDFYPMYQHDRLRKLNSYELASELVNLLRKQQNQQQDDKIRRSR